MRTSFAIIIALLVSGPTVAHQDRILSIADDGTLDGIPAEFGPAELKISFSQSERTDEAPVEGVNVRLGEHHTTVPQCLTNLIQTRDQSGVQVLASWYHDESLIPYYLIVEFFDPGYDEARLVNSGFSFLFNLRTAELLGMEVMILRNGGLQRLPMDISALCGH